ncbi:hypothetical protein D778_02818 [Xanthomarina gelatinilytica]|uniref:Uncharacterized protein n=1 Tax=Xanthomarina gelatinilytica TaxID=1137281 RepID=M7MJS9_9FLAO|nr:hypothetical protein D778_02818 [Xanthomarina gelatinilytica]
MFGFGFVIGLWICNYFLIFQEFTNNYNSLEGSQNTSSKF